MATLLGLVALWLMWGFSNQYSLLRILLGALAIGFAHAWILALEFALLSAVDPGPDVARPKAWALVRAWWGEVWNGTKVFGYRQPFRWSRYPDLLPTGQPVAGATPRGVMLVHGFVCNRGLWNPWLKHFQQVGVPFIAVNLEPVFGSIDDYVDTLAAAHARLLAATGQPPLVVAHSMGGLAVRAWLASRAVKADIPGEPIEVITVGTPHAGTWLARFGLTRNARQMRLNSPWLQDLARRERATGTPHRFTCFYGHCDNIVFPATTATLPGADNHHLAGTAHVHLLFRPEVFQAVMARVGHRSPPAGTSH